MKIDSIEIRNYGSFFGSHTFQFDRKGLVLVLGENLDEPRLKSNGSGKSTVFDALDWVLFGDIPRGDHVDSVVNEEAGGDTEVTVKLIDADGVVAQVSRRRGVKGHDVKPNGAALVVGGADRTALDDAETQRSIERFLGLDREVFHALVLHAQTDTWSFATATDPERIAILTKVLQLDVIDEWLVAAKLKLATAESRSAELAGGLSVLKGQQSELGQLDYTALSAQWEIDRAVDLAKAQETYERLSASASELRGRVLDRDVVAAQLLALESTAPRKPSLPSAPLAPLRPAPPKGSPTPPYPAPPDMTELNSAYAQTDAALLAMQTDVQVQRREAANKLKEAELFAKTATGTCGECRQPIGAEHVAAEVARLHTAADLIATKLAPIEQVYAQWQAYRAGLDGKSKALDTEYTDTKASYQAELVRLASLDATALAGYNAELARLDADYQSTLASYRADVAGLEREYSTLLAAHAVQVSGLRQQIQTIESQAKLAVTSETQAHEAHQRLTALQNQTNVWVVKAEELRGRLAYLEQAVRSQEASIESDREQVRYLDFWVQGLGPRGLKNYIMDARVQELTDSANHWMRLLYGGTAWLRFETQVQGRSTGKLTNRLNIRCFRYMPDGSVRERNFKSMSGGEKQRTSLAIDLGLSRLIAGRATKRYDLLILDEVFKHLDSAGRDAVVDMLQELRVEKSTIFVVDHSEDFKGAFESTVTVVKQNGRTTIKGETSDKEVRDGVSEKVVETNAKVVPDSRPVSRTPVNRRRKVAAAG